MLRKARKNRRYNEEANDEDGERKFDIQDQIKSERFDLINRDKHLLETSGDRVTLNYFQEHGFEKPILVEKPDGLNLTVPSSKFLVRDVRNCVGPQRIIDVMDVRTQKNTEMSMKDWCKYYESKHRDRLLNVISLEFSHTKLDELVDSPMIVKLLDWVDLVWPKFLKQAQTESTNSIDKMKYPKVQKYCLMSVKGSYTDFHIDFGGTSVWYHILRGRKIFWMVPPTDLNLQTFEEWTLSGMQQDVFFGDTVEECFRVELSAGNTFFIPSGWIHAVYTLEDSLVFGGNFLHSFGIENQLRVSKIEDSTRVPHKFRYPFYTEILWYVVQHYVHCLTGKDHLHRPEPSYEPLPQEKQESNNKKKILREADEETEDEDEEGEESSTESERDDNCDSKKKAKVAPKKRGRPPKNLAKKLKKFDAEDEDGESTEIDSAGEELVKSSEKPKTCRMTKNSLSRLQYEIKQEEQARVVDMTETKVSPKRQISTSPMKQVSPDSRVEQNPVENIPAMASSNHREPYESNGWFTTLAASTMSNQQTSWLRAEPESKDPPKVHLTRFELNGLKALVKHLSKLSGAKKNLPALIRNSRVLLDDCKKMIAEHENDSPELAITGKPITIDLLNTKRADINEMIRQFFKPVDANDTSTSHTDSISTPDELSFRGSDHRIHDDDRHHHKHSLSASPEKISSPSKKSSFAQLTSSSTNPASSDNSKPPQRPKSPPTRPLSNNQYTSKTRTNTGNTNNNNTNFLLPGSFADLIAATSTEKKVFDISGADVASSLFGTKDLTSTKHSSPSHSTKSGKTSSEFKEESNPASLIDSMIRDPINDAPTMHETSKDSKTAFSKQRPNSPEPPKTPVQQKRFINPGFRPLNKEKLIFASAPYVSPVHEQSRSSTLYPWQSPAPTQPATHPPQTQETHTIQKHDEQARPSNTTQHQAEEINASNETLTYNPKESQPPTDNKNDLTATRVICRKSSKSPEPSNQGNEAFNSALKIESATPTSVIKLIEKRDGVSPTTSSEVEQAAKKQTTPRCPPKKSKEARRAIESLTNSEDQSQPIQQQQPTILQPQTQAPPISQPISVVRFAAPKITNQAQKTASVKPKQKRAKKQRDELPNQAGVVGAPTLVNASVVQSIVTVPNSMPSQVRPQGQQSVICGLVTQPAHPVANGAKVSQQQYLISRPLLFNTMPSMSTAQFQQLARPTVPIMNPIASPGISGLTLQQGARIVWATHQQPRGASPTQIVPSRLLTSPIATNSIQTTSMPKVLAGPISTIGPPSTTSAGNTDNAALLSLATTALSTASMTSASPSTLSQVGSKAPMTQAIMVSSASSHPGFIAGQPFFQPIVQRVPMATQFLPTTPVSGSLTATRPQGQYVLTRLPNQNPQARFLITQPGFIAGQRLQAPSQFVAGQSAPRLAFATYKPPTDNSKAMKPKKVKTS